MTASRLRRLRTLLRPTASSESMDRLNDIPLRPANARPRPAPAMVMEPDKSRFQRHSAHLRTRIVDSRVVGEESTGEPDVASSDSSPSEELEDGGLGAVIVVESDTGPAEDALLDGHDIALASGAEVEAPSPDGAEQH